MHLGNGVKGAEKQKSGVNHPISMLPMKAWASCASGIRAERQNARNMDPEMRVPYVINGFCDSCGFILSEQIKGADK